MKLPLWETHVNEVFEITGKKSTIVKWLHIAEAYDGRYGMPIFVWTVLLVCLVSIYAVWSVWSRNGRRIRTGSWFLILFVVVWGIHTFVTYYTIVNLYSFRHYTSFLGMTLVEHERLYFALLTSILQMGLVSTMLLLVLSFIVCMRTFHDES